MRIPTNRKSILERKGASFFITSEDHHPQ
jgi:hypothetical protein